MKELLVDIPKYIMEMTTKLFQSELSFQRSRAFHQRKMKAELKNAGILSGNEFAILAEGNNTENAYSMNSKCKSGFENVSNYGILAGRVIVGDM